MTNRDHSDVQPLLRPVRLGALELPNRVVMAPMTRVRVPIADHAPTELQAEYYAQRAGAGLIISEGTGVYKNAVGAIGVPAIITDPQTAGWAKVTNAVHEAGGRMVSQFGESGSLRHPDTLGGRVPGAPSAVNPGATAFTPSGIKDTVTPRAFTADEIADLIAAYGSAAINARRAGFDGAEIHAQGPHLVGQFLSRHLNRRTDAYGGTLEKRAQFLMDILDALHNAWDGAQIGVKISPYWSSGTAFTADEQTLDEYDQLVKTLSANDLAYLHLMGPFTVADSVEAHIAPFARYRALYNGPIVANVGFTRQSGNEIIDAGVADAVSFGTPFIANPDLVDRFESGHPLAEHDPATTYGGHAEGYTDYPAISTISTQER